MKRFLAPIAILLVALTATKALADQRKDNNDNGNEQSRPPSKSSLTDSVRRVERQTGGQVLSAEPMQRDGRQVNRVKVLTNDGRVRVMQVDAHQNRDKKIPPVPRSQNNADKGGGDPNQF